MKTLLLALIAFISCSTITHAQVQRRVLYEGFTSETCPPSVGCDANLWTLMASGTNPQHIQVITFITPYPSMSALYNTNAQDYNARRQYYNIQFVPYGRLDGEIHDTATTYRGHSAHLTQVYLDSEIAKPSPFILTATHQVDASGTVTISVDASTPAGYAPPGNGLKLYAALVRTLDYVTPPGNTTQTHFFNMVRKMYPSPVGTPIGNSWSPGSGQSFTITGLVPSEKTDSMVHPHTSSPDVFVVWIQDDSTKNVAQVATSVEGTPTSVRGNTATSGISLQPNPAGDFTSIHFNSIKAETISVQVFDASGKLVLEQGNLPLKNGEEVININTSRFLPGYYNIVLNGGSERWEQSLVVYR